MDLIDDLGFLGLVVLWILDVIGWWVALFLWLIPTLSIGLGEILTLQIWTIVAIVLFFVAWMPLMIAGVIIALIVLFN